MQGWTVLRAAGWWHNLPVVVLACEVGVRSVFQTGNPVHQMVLLIHQAANTFQMSAHLEFLFAFLGCNVSCAITGSTMVATGIVMQLCKSIYQMLPTSCRYKVSAILQIVPLRKSCGLDVIGTWAVT